MTSAEIPAAPSSVPAVVVDVAPPSSGVPVSSLLRELSDLLCRHLTAQRRAMRAGGIALLALVVLSLVQSWRILSLEGHLKATRSLCHDPGANP